MVPQFAPRPRGSAFWPTRLLWVGLQADAVSRFAKDPVGLKPDPPRSAPPG